MAPAWRAALVLVAACISLDAGGALAAAPQQQQRAIAERGRAAPDAAAATPSASGALRALIKPATPVWPQQLSASLFQNRSGSLAMTSLYYDWKHKRNLNLIQTQLGARGEVWDIEHQNGTSFIFSRQEPLCKVLHFDVGILTPNWLENATLLGQGVADGFVVDVWTKSDFIEYYQDDAADRPVRWTFLGSGAEFHVMTWSPGGALSDAHWQAPAYCFGPAACTADNPGAVACAPSVLDEPSATGQLMRMPAAAAAGGVAAAAAAVQGAAAPAGRGSGNGGGSVPSS
ncbi:MAG: hypothetical protein J3K34DRAFT_198117 [Monoraphidium minutum]|nr:MAG: hypothetical protein J3K34DRAFT_198117 [Monoraphidium minutum]